MLRLTIFVVLVLCLCSNANAQGGAEAPFETGASKFISELLECFGYFSIAVASMERRSDAGTVENQGLIRGYKAAASKALNFAFATGHQIGLTSEALIARNGLVMEELQKKINHSMTNIALLISTYQRPCRTRLNASDLFDS